MEIKLYSKVKMKDQYTLEELIERFAKHSESFRDEWEKCNHKYCYDYFNLSAALASVCIEFKLLKEEIASLKQEIEEASSISSV